MSDSQKPLSREVYIKPGASEWMRSRNYWLDSYPKSLDGLSGKIIADYSLLPGDDSHYALQIEGIESLVGVNPKFLEPKQSPGVL